MRIEEIQRAASKWLIDVSEDPSAQQLSELEQWLAADPLHRATFIRVRTAWMRLNRMARLRPPEGEIDPDLLLRVHCDESPLKASAKSHERADSSFGTGLGTRAYRWWKPRWRMLAAMAIAILILPTSWYLSGTGTWLRYTTSVGQYERITLSDGSEVTLNTDTVLLTRYSADRREIVLLRGEALFKVAQDIRRPFLVKAGDTQVQGVGKQFSVYRADAHDVQVLVSDGPVSVQRTGMSRVGTNPATLGAGEYAHVQHGSLADLQHLDLPAVSRKLAWAHGLLVFQGETLSEVVKEFNRYNRRQLVIADPSIATRRIGGVFQPTDPDSFLAGLSKEFGVIAADTDGSGAVVRLEAAKRPRS
jgi:transmembrane sensor